MKLKFFTANVPLLSLMVGLLGASCMSVCGSGPALAERQTQAVVRTSGRLVNLKGEGVPNIPVYLWEQKGELSLAAKSKADGGFSFEHPACSALTLEILPPVKTSYASALIDDVPGDENRKLIVDMHMGHLISGRVTHDGKGLKGILVKVRPVELSKHGGQIDYSSLERSEKIHGGGTTITGKDGAFTLVITPGHKQLSIINNKYPKFEKKVEHNLTVRENLNVGALHL